MRNFREDFINRVSKYMDVFELDAFISSQEADIANYMYYMYANTPLADIFNVDREIFLDYAVAGDILRKERCKDMDEDMFLQNVLFHRVGTEIIKPCRTFFQTKWMSSLGEEEEENVKKINYICGDEVIYTTTDIRTLDAMTVFRSGFGRCGEESVFAVNVFRSLGIPARQVYSVYWAHCDDNHAWVEVFVNGSWKYLGACEPEEILNKGWFNAASARAMLICSREYRDGGILRLNQSSRYMDTVNFAPQLLYQNKPLSNVDIELQIPNFARLATLISLKTDENGRFEIEIGKGHVMIKIAKYDVHIPIHTQRENHGVLHLEDYITSEDIWKEMMWEAPVPSNRNDIKANSPRKSMYQAKPFINEKQKKAIMDAGFEHIWEILSEKDKRDIRFEIVKDCAAVHHQENISDEIHLHYVLNPRVDFENLSLCRELARSMFKTKDDIENFFGKVEILQEEMIFETDAVLKHKIGNLHSVNIAKVHAYRSLGIPAKLENGLVFVYANNDFEVQDNREGTYLKIDADIEDYMKKYSIAPKAESYLPMTKASLQSSNFVHLGRNLIMTSKRLQNGNQAIAYKYTTFHKNDNNSLDLHYMEYRLEDLLSNITLNADFKSLVPFEDGIIIWAKENYEPTRHIMGELLEARAEFEHRNILLLFSEEYSKQDALLEEVLTFSDISLIDNLGERLQEMFGRGLFVNHETLPMVANMEDSHINYAFSGYSVGNIEILKEILNRAAK